MEIDFETLLMKRTTPETRMAFLSVLLERARQDQKWGQQNHDPHYWTSILMEEVGEFCRAVMEGKSREVREELVQVAAVALAMLECCDRNGWDKE